MSSSRGKLGQIRNIFQYGPIYKRPVELVSKIRKGTMSVVALPRSDSFTALEVKETILRMGSVIKGTAFAVASNQFVTCNHVIDSLFETHQIILHGHYGTFGPPSIIHHVSSIRSDTELDLTLMETDKSQGEITPIRVGKELPPVGLDVLAVGYPLPEQSSQIDANLRKIDVDVTGIFRAIRGIVASRLADGIHFEIDKLVNPGQSGGPVVAVSTGELVGMSQAFRSYVRIMGDQPTTIVADLSMCLSVHAIRRRLIEWGCEI